MAHPTGTSAPSPRNSGIVKGGGAFILIILAMISLLGVSMAVGDVIRWVRVDGWEPVSATVTRASIKEDTSTRDAFRWRPIVDFEYEVAGQRYEESNRKRIDEMARTEAESYIDARKPGTTIEAWYDPNDHDDATLDPDPPFMRAETLGFLVPSLGLWVYFGGWLIPAMLKKRREAA